MITIDRFEHLDFTSNTYLIRHKVFNENVYLIDIGSAQMALEALEPNQVIKGIFLTHAHFDHIYGINDIIDKFPECVVYCAEYAHEGLLSDKLNLSFYHLEPLVFKGGCVTLLLDGMSIELFANYYLKVLETVGHNKGSLSFIIPGGIFTGDALIPGVKIVTKLKSGNKEDAIESVLKIRKALHPSDNIYPGHGPVCRKLEVDWRLYGERNQY